MITYVFYGSLIAMAGMLSVKLYEMKRRRRSAIYHLFSHFDEIMHGAVGKIFGAFRTTEKQATHFLTVDLPRIVYRRIVTLAARLRDSYDKLRKGARGVQKLKENPKVSAFLRDIEEAKREMEAKNSEDKEEK